MRVRALAFLSTSTLALLYSAYVLAQQTEQPPPWGWYGPTHAMGGFGWGLWWMMPLMMLFFFLMCGVFLWVLFLRGGAHHWGPPWHRMGGSGGSWRDPTRSALQILNERFAKGEIDKAEYEERKATILASREH